MPAPQPSNISRTDRPSSSTTITMELIGVMKDLSVKIEGGVASLVGTVDRLEKDLRAASEEDARRSEKLESALASQSDLLRSQGAALSRLVELREKQEVRESAEEAHRVKLREIEQAAARERAAIELEAIKARSVLELEHAKAENDAKISVVRSNAEARNKIMAGAVIFALLLITAIGTWLGIR